MWRAKAPKKFSSGIETVPMWTVIFFAGFPGVLTATHDARNESPGPAGRF
jgi:hypothetical protein